MRKEKDITTDLAWQGRIGSVELRVQVPQRGTILAEWDSAEGPRRKMCKSVQELERSVLFQVMVSGGETDPSVARKVVEAVTEAEATRAPRVEPQERVKPRRKNPKARHHRRSRRPPRRR